MRALAYCGVVLGTLLILAAVVLAITAIWTVGPDARRFLGTSFVALVVGGVIGCVGLNGANGGKR